MESRGPISGHFNIFPSNIKQRDLKNTLRENQVSIFLFDQKSSVDRFSGQEDSVDTMDEKMPAMKKRKRGQIPGHAQGGPAMDTRTLRENIGKPLGVISVAYQL